MAIFNPDQDPKTVDYTGQSHGVKANTAAADLFGAAGEIGVAAVKIADQNNLQNIQREVNSEVDQLNNEWGTSASAFETNVNSQNIQPLPQDLQRYGKHLGDVRKAYLNGSLKESNYQMRIDSMSRQIRARYPGYRQEIDKIVNSTLGLSTANDLRKTLMAEWANEAAKVDDDTKRYAQEVTQARKDGALPPDWDRRNAAGNPYTMAETRMFMASRYQQDADMDRTKKSLDLIDKSSEAGKKAVYDSASKEISLVSQRIFEGGFSVGGMTIGQLREKANAGMIKPFSPTEQAEIVAGFANFKSTVESQVVNRLSQPEYATLTQQQRDDLKKNALAQVDIVQDALLNQQYGMVNFSKQMNDTNLQNDIRKLDADPVVRLKKILKDYPDGQLIIDNLLTQNPELGTAFNNVLLSYLTGELANRGEKSLDSIIKTTADKNGGQLDPAVIKQTIHNATKMLLQKDASLEIASQAATILFSEENQDFLGRFTQKSQTQIFDTLISPRMTERMMELGKSDPQMFTNYRNWVLNSFTSLFNQDIATINDMNQFGDSLQIKWDAATGQFKEEVNPQATQRGALKQMLPGGSLAQAYESWSTSEAKSSMSQLNKYVKQLKPIIEAEGGTVEEAVTALFEANGVGKAQNQGSLFFRLYDAMAKGNIDPKTGKPNEVGGRFPTKDQMEKIKNQNNNPETQEFDLDKTGSGKLGANSKLKETIRKAEGTTNSYNTRFGGATDIELSLYDVGDVMDIAKMSGKKTGSGAIGAYQFMPATIDRLVKLGVIAEDDRFTPELQEKMADYLIAEATQGAKGREDAGKKLAGVWAGLPQGPDNSSPYTGVGMNKGPTISWDELMAAF